MTETRVGQLVFVKVVEMGKPITMYEVLLLLVLNIIQDVQLWTKSVILVRVEMLVN